MKNKKGKLIVLEGIDGSGKSTQTKLLLSRLEKEGLKTATIDFPQYGRKSAGLVQEYLNGSYGEVDEVGPYRASIFYACDRYDASSKIRTWIQEGRIVVADRYTISNIGHQGGKIRNLKKWREFTRWIYELEYGLFGISKPDLIVILKTSPDVAYSHSESAVRNRAKKKKRAGYLNGGGRDVHERDRQHLARALASYIRFSRENSHECEAVNCLRAGEFLPPEVIHKKVWLVVAKVLWNIEF